MTVVIDSEKGFSSEHGERVGLECPYCNVYSHMTPQSVPDVDDLLHHRPKHVGLVYRCDACDAPVFLRFAVKQFGDSQVELYRNFVELERPKERFAFSYLPKDTEILFREALSCYSSNNFNAFASMCRRSASSAYAALGEGGRLRAFEEIVIAQDIAGIDDDTPDPVGGKIIRDDNGKATGVLIDIAMALVEKHVPDPTRSEIRESYASAIDSLLALGITGVHDAGINKTEAEVYMSMADDGELGMRIYAMLSDTGPNLDAFAEPIRAYGNDHLDIASVKLYSDGALGSRGLETDTYPTATFVLTEPIDLGTVPTEGESISVSATGDLTLHGVTNSVVLELEGVLVDGTMIVVGSTEVTLTDYDIEAPTGFSVLTIEEVGTLEVQLAFVPS